MTRQPDLARRVSGQHPADYDIATQLMVLEQ